MRILLLGIAKTKVKYLKQAEEDYLSRLKHYTKLEYKMLPGLKKAGALSPSEMMKAEGDVLLKQIQPDDLVVLLDEHGAGLSSKEFASYIEQKQNQSFRRVVFVIGGAFGFSAEVRARANKLLSLSRMTFSHQMIRFIFLEQLYRAFTIIRHEPYHNE